MNSTLISVPIPSRVWNAYVTYDGKIFVPCIYGIGSNRPKCDPLVIRSRPTGERGSGPYFKAIAAGDKYGIRSALNMGTYVFATGCQSTFCWDGYFDDTTTQLVSNGTEAYSITYRTDHKGSFYYIKRNDQLGKYEYCSQYSIVANSIDDVYEYMLAYPKAVSSTAPGWTRTGLIETYIPDHFSFKYEEEDAFDWYAMTGYMSPGYTALATASYIDAMSSLPEASCNSIANVLEIAGSITDAIHGKFPDLTSVKNIWLAYRYQYCTTKADIEEYAELTRRLQALAGLSTIQTQGSAHHELMSCRTVASLDAADVIPQTTIQWLNRYGFKLSAVNAWDMVPYSFIVDWFLHVGDILEAFEKQDRAFSLRPYNVWHTFQSEYDGQFCFFRVPNIARPGLPYIDYGPASKKTLAKRVTDTVALFFA